MSSASIEFVSSQVRVTTVAPFVKHIQVSIPWMRPKLVTADMLELHQWHRPKVSSTHTGASQLTKLAHSNEDLPSRNAPVCYHSKPL